MEQEASSFGDHRLDRASRFIHDRLTSHGPGGTHAGGIRIGRFPGNEQVTEDRIIGPVAAAQWCFLKQNSWK